MLKFFFFLSSWLVTRGIKFRESRRAPTATHLTFTFDLFFGRKTGFKYEESSINNNRKAPDRGEIFFGGVEKKNRSNSGQNNGRRPQKSDFLNLDTTNAFILF